jgi:AhpD family alkylhydroperoxidase
MTNYPEQYAHLQKLVARLMMETPGTLGGFRHLHKESQAEGALSKKTKELMALAISIAGHCDSCIAYHVHDALKAGAARKEILETIGVAIMMGGGPALMYGCDALEALEQFEAKSKAA